MRLIALYTIARVVFGLAALAAPKTVGRALAGDDGAAIAGAGLLAISPASSSQRAGTQF